MRDEPEGGGVLPDSDMSPFCAFVCDRAECINDSEMVSAVLHQVLVALQRQM